MGTVTANRKPRDIGNGLVCGSFGQGGAWLSMGTVDPDAGFVELTGLPIFDPELRDNAAAVLRFRSWMRRDEHAFLQVDAGRASITTRQDAPRGSRGLVQRLVIRASRRDRPTGIRLHFRGHLSRPTLAVVPQVDAAELAGEASQSAGSATGRPAHGAPTPDPSAWRLEAREGTLRIIGEGPSVIVQAWLRKGDAGATDRRSDMRVTWKQLRRRMPTAEAWIGWPPERDEVHLDIACSFDLPSPAAPDWPVGGFSPGEQAAGNRPLHVPARLVRPLGRITQRAASYARTTTALQLDGSSRCILVDHRIMPLSLAPDAYWQARLLLESWSRGSHDDDVAIVGDHLRWLFLRCERVDGRWAPAYDANGQRRAGQAGVGLTGAEPQLYPLLELADYVAATGRLPELPEGESWPALVDEAWSVAEDDVDAKLQLIGVPRGTTMPARNSQDNGPPGPFRAADQILLWHVAARLGSAAAALQLAGEPFATRAATTRDAFREHLVVDGRFGSQWASQIDTEGAAELRIDATDLPLFLAPLWSFCKPSDRAWRSTVRFAFDPANPSFAPGTIGGLGTRTTPGVWTLGDVARWVAAGSSGDHEVAGAALQRLTEIAYDDGMLPEAYDPDGSGSAVRHWFAWPGAALGAIVLSHAVRSTGS